MEIDCNLNNNKICSNKNNSHCMYEPSILKYDKYNTQHEKGYLPLRPYFS